jgi:hypothetical protein
MLILFKKMKRKNEEEITVSNKKQNIEQVETTETALVDLFPKIKTDLNKETLDEFMKTEFTQDTSLYSKRCRNEYLLGALLKILHGKFGEINNNMGLICDVSTTEGIKEKYLECINMSETDESKKIADFNGLDKIDMGTMVAITYSYYQGFITTFLYSAFFGKKVTIKSTEELELNEKKFIDCVITMYSYLIPYYKKNNALANFKVGFCDHIYYLFSSYLRFVSVHYEIYEEWWKNALGVNFNSI